MSQSLSVSVSVPQCLSLNVSVSQCLNHSVPPHSQCLPLSVPRSITQCLSLSLSAPVSQCLSVSVSVPLSHCLSLPLSASMSQFLSASLPVSLPLSQCLSLSLSASMSQCLLVAPIPLASKHCCVRQVVAERNQQEGARHGDKEVRKNREAAASLLYTAVLPQRCTLLCCPTVVLPHKFTVLMV